ncbi:hypothetical protein ANO14919_054810 [Xylariales sp. No.14919]|nr:hypothetical protein ANO14919_054810 [Xylariales sp. No.14919]
MIIDDQWLEQRLCDKQTTSSGHSKKRKCQVCQWFVEAVVGSEWSWRRRGNASHRLENDMSERYRVDEHEDDLDPDEDDCDDDDELKGEGGTEKD